MNAAYAEIGILACRTGGTAASALETALERRLTVQQFIVPLKRYLVHILRTGSLYGESEFIHRAGRLESCRENPYLR